MKQASKAIEDVRQSQPIRERWIIFKRDCIWPPQNGPRPLEPSSKCAATGSFPEADRAVDCSWDDAYENLNEPGLNWRPMAGWWARNPESTPARAGLAAAQIALGHGDDALEHIASS